MNHDIVIPGGVDGVMRSSAAIAEGRSGSAIDRLVRRGEWLRPYPGVLITRPSDDPEVRWRSELTARILYAGPGAALSHRTAASRHGLDADWGFPTDITVPRTTRRRIPGLIRSDTLLPDDVQSLRGFAVTSVRRTLFDLGRFASVDQVEAALESALRGSDRTRPDIWNQALYADLIAGLASRAGTRGAFRLQCAIDRRSARCRPTGSYPETLLLQSARRLGIDLLRQPDVEIRSRRRLLARFFPDFAVAGTRLLVEVDGFVGHSTPGQLTRDAARQNQLASGFRIRRIPASAILSDREGAARSLVRTIADLDPVGERWTEDGVTVRRSPTGFIVQH